MQFPGPAPVALVFSALALLVVPAAGAAADVGITGNPVLVISPTSTQLVVNGSFDGISPKPWIYAGSAAVVSGAHCGTKSLMLGSGGDAVYATDGLAHQQLSVPANANGVDLDFWLIMAKPPAFTGSLPIIGESEGLEVRVNGTRVFAVGNDVQSSGAWTHIGPISLSQYRGQTIDLQFVGSSVSVAYGAFGLYVPPPPLPVSLRVDDVAVWTGTHLLLSNC
jgi:hypothetical protein